MKTSNFYEMPHDEVLDKVKSYVPQMKSSKGGKYVLCMLKNPRKAFPYIYLENCFKNDEINGFKEVHDFDILQNSMRCIIETPYFMCDAQTKREVEKRLNDIENKLATNSIDNKIILYDLQREKEQLVRYLSEVLNDNGTIKKFDEALNNPKRAVKMNLRRFLIELADFDPILTENLRKNFVKEKFTVMYFS